MSIVVDPVVIKGFKPDSFCISLQVDGQIVQHCIGSGETQRDAKACALHNVRQLLAKLEKLETT